MNVYDFDNTIYDGESGADLFMYFFRKTPQMVRGLPWAIKLFKDYKITKLPLSDILEIHSAKVEAFGDKYVGDLDELAVDFWDKHSYKIKSFYINQHRDDDVIITACLDFLMDEVGKRLGITNIIASEVNKKTKRLIRFCFKENKVKMFNERYPGQRIENLYTDSYNDRLLMDISDNVYLVKGNKIKKIK